MNARSRYVVGMLLLTLVAGTAAAQSSGYAQVDRERLIAHLEKSAKDVEEAVRNLTPAQWNFKPAADRWSVAQVVEHLAAAEEFLVQGLVEGQVLKSPAMPEKKNALAQIQRDYAVLRNIPDRSTPAQAPEPIQPTNRYTTPAGALKAMAAARQRTIDLVRTTKLDLRSHFMDFGPMGPLDGHQWLLFTSAHFQRHTAQILEVKAHANFPK